MFFRALLTLALVAVSSQASAIKGGPSRATYEQQLPIKGAPVQRAPAAVYEQHRLIELHQGPTKIAARFEGSLKGAREERLEGTKLQVAERPLVALQQHPIKGGAVRGTSERLTEEPQRPLRLEASKGAAPQQAVYYEARQQQQVRELSKASKTQAPIKEEPQRFEQQRSEEQQRVEQLPQKFEQPAQKFEEQRRDEQQREELPARKEAQRVEEVQQRVEAVKGQQPLLIQQEPAKAPEQPIKGQLQEPSKQLQESFKGQLQQEPIKQLQEQPVKGYHQEPIKAPEQEPIRGQLQESFKGQLQQEPVKTQQEPLKTQQEPLKTQEPIKGQFQEQYREQYREQAKGQPLREQVKEQYREPPREQYREQVKVEQFKEQVQEQVKGELKAPQQPLVQQQLVQQQQQLVQAPFKGQQQLEERFDAAPLGQAEPYAFSYEIDGSSRTESGDTNGAVRGQYTINGPGGTRRVVTYVADANGFRADVNTNEFGTEGHPSARLPVEVRQSVETQLPLEQGKTSLQRGQEQLQETARFDEDFKGQQQEEPNTQRKLPEEPARKLPWEPQRKLPEEGQRKLPEEPQRRLTDEIGQQKLIEELPARKLPEEPQRRLTDELKQEKLTEEPARKLPEELPSQKKEEPQKSLPLSKGPLNRLLQQEELSEEVTRVEIEPEKLNKGQQQQQQQLNLKSAELRSGPVSGSDQAARSGLVEARNLPFEEDDKVPEARSLVHHEPLSSSSTHVSGSPSNFESVTAHREHHSHRLVPVERPHVVGHHHVVPTTVVHRHPVVGHVVSQGARVDHVPRGSVAATLPLRAQLQRDRYPPSPSQGLRRRHPVVGHSSSDVSISSGGDPRVSFYGSHNPSSSSFDDEQPAASGFEALPTNLDS